MLRCLRAAAAAGFACLLIAAGQPPALKTEPLIPAALALNAAPVTVPVILPPAPPEAPSASLSELVRTRLGGSASDGLSDETRCLATAVYHEARGEPLEGQLAVAKVVLNRVKSRRFADSVCGVVYQPQQFSFVGKVNRPRNTNQWQRAIAVANIAVKGALRSVADNATHFHAVRVKPGWRGLTRVAQIGNHIFYR